MRRRALLAALAASATATAGCSMLSGDERPRETFGVPETPTEATTSASFDPPPEALSKAFTVPGGDDRRVAVTAPTEIPEDVSITLGFTSAPSTDTPATLYARVGVRNTAGGPVDLPVGATPPLSAYRGVHDPGADADGEDARPMLLVPQRAGAAFDDVVRRDQACWRPELPVGPQDGTGGTRRLDPGETLTREYYLVTPWATDRCLRPGAYRFETAAGWQFHVCPFRRERPGASANAERSVPDLPGFRDTGWYHDTDPDLYLRPDAEQVGLPSATARFRFRNQTDSRVVVDEAAWALYKLVAGSWYPIAPLAAPSGGAGETPIYPGRASTLSFSLFTDPDVAEDDERRAIGGLGQGTYGVLYPASLEARGPNAGRTPPTAALLGVVGNPPTVDATDAIDHVTDRGDARHVHTSPDESGVATLRLEPTTVDEDRGATSLITEQVLQRDALRNALVELRGAPDDADAVVYHTDPTAIARTTAWIDDDPSGVTFTYDGDAYAMTYG